ncbi:MAG: glycoside hydrolase family 78 protein [Dysgonamonadaceae bacterium]|jgi:alpha-L-rhamnosidase|nr:glycoside hydrolase family 78 protein [Dysgonamonadaceae bacterium]
MTRIIYTIITLLTICLSCNNSPNLQIYDLRCENLTAPLGINTTTPRFSWKLASDKNGSHQVMYQILAATDSLLLSDGKADLWNSGRVSSSASVMVPYLGKELQARSNVYWKVGVWDDGAKRPVWSKVSHFSVGLLEPADWYGASYIGFPDEAGDPQSPLLRKQFEMKSLSEKTYLYVNSLGYHEIYINGEKVGIDVLSPAVSQLDKRSHVITYDVSSYVSQGRNDLIIWLGRGWFQPKHPGVVYDGPVVKAQLETLTKGSWNTLFVTDTTWSARESGYTGTSDSWSMWRLGGDRIDARSVLADFNAATLDAASWVSANVINIPAHIVSPQMVEPNRIVEKIRPVSITPYEIEGRWLVDMGRTLTGQVEITFPQLTEGQEIVMFYACHLLDGRPYNPGQVDRYIASGKSGEKFRNKFHYHGFRYITISNLHTEPSLDDITAYLIQTNFRDASSFESSDADMNAIHDMVKYTLRLVGLGGYMVDCPQFERIGYGGDGNASSMTAQTMFDLSPLYYNWMQAWADVMREDGGLPHTAPNPFSAGGGPYWCGFFITGSWDTYINYGDSRLIEKYYPLMQRWMEYVQRYSVNGLLQQWGDVYYRNWYLGDWAAPDGVDQTNKASIDLVVNSFISVCYETMAKIAAFLGKEDDAAIYTTQKEQLRNTTHKRFFDSATNSYATGSQIDLIYPMLVQATPPSLIPAITNTLYTMTEQDKNGHLATGLVGIAVLTEWAIKNHAVDWVYDMLKKRTYPGYLYMIDNGATAVWEHWEGTRSHIHNCYNGIGQWFYEAIGGIRPDRNFPGYQRVIISPQIPHGITWAKTSKETPYGTVVVHWELTEDKTLHIDLIIPPGSTAMLEFPENVEDYTVNGTKFRVSTDAINPIVSGKHRIVYKL